tara:strand:- start:711 stop:863 length:153 start_codon:yes stop_codon:yes gene_type:complete
LLKARRRGFFSGRDEKPLVSGTSSTIIDILCIESATIITSSSERGETKQV